MSKKAELTIILPNYNSQLYLKKTLQSITSQSYQKWNLIIVDDNSNVETKKILNKFGKHRKIKIFYLRVNLIHFCIYQLPSAMYIFLILSSLIFQG